MLLAGSSLPVVVSGARAQTAPQRPFPYHTSYTAGTIKPSFSQADLDAATQAFYGQWKAVYLASGCGTGRRYVSVIGNKKVKKKKRKKTTISFSEGHGYGMIITALMAGPDNPQAQSEFDGLYAFFRDHPSVFGGPLMAYRQSATCADTDGGDAATDGDMDIAYALLLADKQWGSGGPINYRGEAVKVINAMMAREIHPTLFHPLLGDWVSPDDPKFYNGTRTSDFITNHTRSYGAATGDTRWTNVRNEMYDLVADMQAEHSPQTGLLPDFIEDVNTEPRPADPSFLEGPDDGNYYYNACRDPWRLGTDYLLDGDPRARVAVDRINAFIRDQTGDDPGKIVDGYKLNGDVVGNSDEMEFVAPFGVGAMLSSGNQNWLNDVWEHVVDRPVAGDDYYGNTLKLLSMLVMSGNWWAPHRA